ncbi:uncharacterized protein LOC112468380, partial [Temnothorax curvispinosus]|uniref:Uncharacterized protein LOC112468380 n=1 Tax=Temnothorax curvispinosus TaxID=300111 RepID=A0A6J1RET4_9HYME
MEIKKGAIRSPQKIEYHWDGATPRRNISRTIITWVTAISIWLIRKLRHFVNVVSFSIFVQNEDSRFLAASAMSEKMTPPENFVQMQTTTEATLNALTAEMNVFREASKKITEDNMKLMQEMKKLRKTLEE